MITAQTMHCASSVGPGACAHFKAQRWNAWTLVRLLSQRKPLEPEHVPDYNDEPRNGSTDCHL